MASFSVHYPHTHRAYVDDGVLRQYVNTSGALYDLNHHYAGEAPYAQFINWAFPGGVWPAALTDVVDSADLDRLASLINQFGSPWPQVDTCTSLELGTFIYGLAKLAACVPAHLRIPWVAIPPMESREDFSKRLGPGYRTLVSTGRRTSVGHPEYELHTEYTTDDFVAYLLWRADQDVADGKFIIRCAHCKNLAAIDNPKTIYCSRRCSAAVRQGKFRGKG